MSRPVAVTPQIADGKQSEALVDIEQHIAGDRRCGAEAAAVQQPHVVAVPIEQPLLGVAEQPMERTGLDDFVLERRSLVVHRRIVRFSNSGEFTYGVSTG
jgi:hypothetical protein